VNGYGDAEGNIRRSDDPELQAQAQIAARIVDNDERAKALTEFYKVIRNEGYEIGIGYVNVPWGVGSRIANWEPYPLAPNISGLHTITLK
jgi:ABC-type transport system substrate-binding protein